VLGASLKPERYSYKVIHALREKGHPVVAIGLRKGRIHDVDVQTEWTVHQPIHTVTLYISAERQKTYMELVTSLKPERVIFNPGTENEFFQNELTNNGLKWTEACTLVLLATGQY
jgi:predicted CoA-binding protein